jgi:hypothetical protein
MHVVEKLLECAVIIAKCGLRIIITSKFPLRLMLQIQEPLVKYVPSGKNFCFIVTSNCLLGN